MLHITLSQFFQAHVTDSTGRHLGYMDVQSSTPDAQWLIGRGLAAMGYRVGSIRSIGTLARGGYVVAQVA